MWQQVAFVVFLISPVILAQDPGSASAPVLEEFLQRNPELDQFFDLIRFNTYFNNTLHWKAGTLFVPTNQALEEYLRYHNGKMDQNTLFYHFTNIQTPTREMDEFISTDLPRNPPVWITNANGQIFLNDAQILKRDLLVQIGTVHYVHSIDRVLEPTVPNSAVGGSDLNNPDAKKFLENASLYNITGGMRISEFMTRIALLNRGTSYHNIGKHTFFIPINEGFQKTNIRNVDNKVIDGHIIPGQTLFLRSAPLDIPIQTLTFDSTDPALSHQNFPIFISFEKLNRTDIETWNVISDNRVDPEASVTGSRYRRGKVQAEIVRGNIPVRNGVVHLIRRPLVLIDTTIYEVLETQGHADGGQMSEFFRIVNDHARHTGVYELLQRRDSRKLTLFVPSNEAIEKSRNFIKTVTNKTALAEILKLHIVEQEVSIDDIVNGSRIINTPLEVYTARQDWKLYFTVTYTPTQPVIFVEGGGTSARITQGDIGATNGVIHVINSILGVEDRTIYEKLETIHLLESTFRLSAQNGFNEQFKDESKRFTFFAPSNTAWDKFRTQHPFEYSKLFQGGHSSGSILNRHIILGQELTMDELKNYSSIYGKEFGVRWPVATITDGVRVASVDDPDWESVREKYGEVTYVSSGSGGYRRPTTGSGRVYGDFKHVLFWYNKEAYVVRPDIRTTNGIIHIIDLPLVSPGDVVAGAMRLGSNYLSNTSLMFLILYYINA